MIDVADSIKTTSLNDGTWISKMRSSGYQSSERFGQNRTFLGYEAWSYIDPPSSPPLGKSGTIDPAIKSGGKYHVDYYSKLNGTYTLTFDLSDLTGFLPETVVVVYGVVDFSNVSNFSIPGADWSFTIDTSLMLQWSSLVYLRPVLTVSNPVSWFFKLVGSYLHSLPGRLQIGVKVFGDASSSATKDFSGTFNSTINVSAVETEAILAGDPVSSDSNETLSDWVLA